MSEDAYECSGFERNYPEVDDGFYLVKNGITYKVDLPMDKTRFTKRINILTGEVYYPSNADRIRAMTDEELAELWWERVDCGECPVHKECKLTGQDCKRLALDWLKEEVSTDG